MNTDSSIIEWLLHVASKGAVVLGLALLAGLLLRRVAAARRYAVWMAAMGVLAVLPLAMGVLPAWHVLPMSDEAPLPRVPLEEEATGASPAPKLTRTPAIAPRARTSVPAPSPEASLPPVENRVVSPAISWHTLWRQWPLLWLVGTAGMLVRLVWGAWRLRRLENALPEAACGALAKVARDVGLKHLPCVHVGAADAVPMVWGIGRPRLLLPAGFEAWPQEKLRSVLLHELAHLRRRDPLALWLAQAVKALHWFNPLVWLAFRQLRADQERACDDTVLRHGVRPSNYAQHLLDLSRHARIAPGLALCALTITRCAPVEARVRAVLDARRARQPLTRRWLAGMAALALLTALPVAMLHAIEGPKLRGRILDRNGVVLAESTAEKMRHYPLKQLASHVVGYVGMRAHDASAPRGRAGMEREQDTLLTGGKDVALSLDGRIQALATRAMQEAGCQRGAAVVLDPRTGEILAAISLPAYDASLFVPAISRVDWEVLTQDPDTPLLNRCVQGRYAPGAAFLPLTALAGISAGVGEARFECKGSVTYGSAVFRCWKSRAEEGGHGVLGMSEGLFHGCNCYWYQFGNAAGVDAIAKTGRLLGFDAAYGVTPEDSAGTLPTPEWLATHQPKERWSAGHTANLAIGQGALTTSPLHLAVLAATVAQRGKVPQPTWIKIEEREEAKIRADLIAEGWKPDQIEQIREGMRQVVNKDGSTGKAARSDQVVIAGKTGTAQAWRRVDNKRVEDNNTWFIGFAPYDKPTLAFAVLKQGGKSGGGDCAPIAKRIVEEALALPADGSGEVRSITAPANGAKAADEPRSERLKRQNARVEELRAKAEAAHQQLQELEARTDLLRQKQPADPAALDALFNELRGLIVPRHPLPAGAKFVEQAQMGSAEIERWQTLQKQGALADLPAKARVQLLTKEDRLETGAISRLVFRFSGPREEVRAWLLASLSEKVQKANARMLPWPEAPQPFERLYPTGTGCLVSLHSPDGVTVHVAVSKYRLSPLIAPDEATPPRPKTPAPRELDGLVQAEPGGTLPSLSPGGMGDLKMPPQLPSLAQLPSNQDDEPIPAEPKQKNPFTPRFSALPLRMLEPERLQNLLPKRPRFGGTRFEQSLLVRGP